MRVHVHVDYFGTDTGARASLRSYCEAAMRRALGRDAHAIERVTTTLRRESRVGLSERWTVRVELRTVNGVARSLRADATARRPHGAIDDAALAAWGALHQTDAMAVA